MSLRRFIKIAQWCFISFLLIFLALCTAGEIRQRLLVHRAASLLSDIHSLRYGHSDWRDAQVLMARWGRWGHYDGTCTTADCLYVITLDNATVPADHNVAEWVLGAQYYFSAFRLLPRQWGGGLRLFQGMFLVQNGLVVRSGVAIDMTPSPFAKGAQPACCGSELIMSVRSQGSLGIPGWPQEEGRSRHPDYVTWRPGGCTFCFMGRVTYAASMPVEEAVRLSDFQLSCATRWSSCLTLEELDPAAHDWHLYGSPWGDPPEKATPKRHATGCTLPLYTLGRDADQIISVEALEDGVSLGEDSDGIGRERSRVKVISEVKGHSPWALQSTQKVVTVGTPFDEQMRKPDHLIKSRRYLLILSRDDDAAHEPISLENCRVIEENSFSDAEIMRGLALENHLDGYEPSISLEGFSRHQPTPWDE